MELKKLETNNLLGIGCDGTVINTGSKNGIIAKLEKLFEKPLHWIICQFHGNELPLRHFVIKLDGPTTGPTGFTGVLGKQLVNCELLPIVEFSRIGGEEIYVPDEHQLSTDQKYLLNAYQAITSGLCPEDLVYCNPGNISHSR